MVLALHIPDGFLTLSLAAWGWILAVPAIVLALRATKELDDEAIPLAGVLAAFVFAAQTLQFPVPGGTTGHLLGATLVVVLLGRARGILVLTAVTALQALVFGEGGVLAFGWNLCTMAIIMGVSGGWLYGLFRTWGASITVAGFCAAWFSVQFGSLSVCLLLAASGTSPLLVSLAVMQLTQAGVGLAEGAVTAATLTFLLKVRPQAIPSSKPRSHWGWLPLVLLLGSSLLPPAVFGLDQSGELISRYPAFCLLLILLGLLLVSLAVVRARALWWTA